MRPERFAGGVKSPSGPYCVWYSATPDGAPSAVEEHCVSGAVFKAASSHCVSLCVALAVERPLLSWLSVPTIPLKGEEVVPSPSGELCVCLTVFPVLAFAIAVWFVVWLKTAEFVPVALPLTLP